MQIAINRCINKEVKFYGLKLLGVIVAGIIMIFIWIKFNITAAVLSASLGYAVGSAISSHWHVGRLQKWCYWFLAITSFRLGRYIPRSYIRTFL